MITKLIKLFIVICVLNITYSAYSQSGKVKRQEKRIEKAKEKKLREMDKQYKKTLKQHKKNQSESTQKQMKSTKHQSNENTRIIKKQSFKNIFFPKK